MSYICVLPLLPELTEHRRLTEDVKSLLSTVYDTVFIPFNDGIQRFRVAFRIGI
jgi:hypothetical protein